MFLKKLIRILLSIFIVIFLSFGTIKPLFVSGFFPMHDNTQPARVHQMAKALSFGQFPVRWVPDLGYGFGYPLFNFYAPLPYYIGGTFHLLGFSLLRATKLMFIIGIVFASVSMYFLGREIAGNSAGFAMAVFYMYAPYHAVNIYIRGAVGEFYAYGFLPVLFLGIIKIFKKELKKGIVMTSLSLFCILLSHNISGLIVSYFLAFGLIGYLFYLIFKKQNLFTIYYLLFTISLGFGLSAFFVIPAIAEKKYTRVNQLITGGSDFRKHFVYLDQLWNSPWGFAGSAPGRADGMSFKIGKLHLIIGSLSVLSAFYLYKKKRLKSCQLVVVSCQLLIFLISIFLMLEQSKFIWQILPFFSYIQYPWRFINIVIFSLVIFSSILFILFKKRQAILVIVIIGLTLFFNTKYFTPREYISFSKDEYLSKENLSFKISKISDEYLPPDFNTPQEYSQIADDDLLSKESLVYTKLTDKLTFKKYNIQIDRQKEIVTNLAFFPGWRAYLNKKEIEVKNNQGRVGLSIPSGSHNLVLDFKNTPIRSLGNTISIFCLFLLVYVSLFLKISL